MLTQALVYTPPTLYPSYHPMLQYTLGPSPWGDYPNASVSINKMHNTIPYKIILSALTECASKGLPHWSWDYEITVHYVGDGFLINLYSDDILLRQYDTYTQTCVGLFEENPVHIFTIGKMNIADTLHHFDFLRDMK
jgi:hypothetical protein